MIWRDSFPLNTHTCRHKHTTPPALLHPSIVLFFAVMSYKRKALAYTFKIIIDTVVCLISFSFTRKVFGLCMFCLLLHMLSRYFLINECGYHYGATQHYCSTPTRGSLCICEREGEKRKVLIDLLAVHHVFLSEDGGGRLVGMMLSRSDPHSADWVTLGVTRRISWCLLNMLVTIYKELRNS